MSYDFDVLIIGAGPGGYVAAIRGAQLGLKVALAEMDKPGGVCLNIGCIPSKALIHQAEIFRSAAGLASIGVTVDKSGFDYGKVFQKSRLAADRLSKGVQYLIKKNNITFLAGKAVLTGPHQVQIESAGTHTARAIIIATGSRPRVIPGFEFDDQKVLSSTSALMLQELPKSLVIMGAGAIGMEFAHIMNSFGVKVTLVEMQERVLPLEDAETSAVIVKDFSARGIAMLTSTKALSLKKSEQGVQLSLEDKNGASSVVEAEKLLVAVGRTPNTENLGLEAVGVQLEKGFIKTGDYYQTAVEGVYAIGDVIATPLLAHVASKEGEIAVEHIAGHGGLKRLDHGIIPSAVYCEPQIGSFGPTEDELKAKGTPYRKAVFPYRGIGKAVATESAEGLVKILIQESSGAILAAHVAGSNATEIVHELLLARNAELTTHELATMVHAHPTLSEGVMEAARASEGWAIHI